MGTSVTYGQLYSQDFDTDDTANWTVNDDGTTDTNANFFFDYSSVGIPEAPNSSGTTRGMMLQANLGIGVFGGFSVSPTGESFTGDFKISFDYWGNTHETPAGDGTSNLSYFGFGTSGTFANYPGVSDAIWFAGVADGDSGSDYRVYDHDQRDFSYQIPGAASYDPLIDDAATHPTDLFGNPTRDSDSSPFLQSNFGDVTPPAAMQAAFPSSSLTANSFAGSLSFEWHRMEVIKDGTTASWTIDGLEVVSLDMSGLTALPGDNILFGHSDITNGSPPVESDAFDLLFTLIDNVEVTALNAAADDADFDNDLIVDGGDFLIWQRGFSIPSGSALPDDGDATGEGDVNGLDLDAWQSQFGGAPPISGLAAIPEPSSWVIALFATSILFFTTTPQRRIAAVRRNA